MPPPSALMPEELHCGCVRILKNGRKEYICDPEPIGNRNTEYILKAKRAALEKVAGEMAAKFEKLLDDVELQAGYGMKWDTTEERKALTAYHTLKGNGSLNEKED